MAQGTGGSGGGDGGRGGAGGAGGGEGGDGGDGGEGGGEGGFQIEQFTQPLTRVEGSFSQPEEYLGKHRLTPDQKGRPQVLQVARVGARVVQVARVGQSG